MKRLERWILSAIPVLVCGISYDVLHFSPKAVNRVGEGRFPCILHFMEDLIRRDTCPIEIPTRSKSTAARDACH